MQDVIFAGICLATLGLMFWSIDRNLRVTAATNANEEPAGSVKRDCSERGS